MTSPLKRRAAGRLATLAAAVVFAGGLVACGGGGSGSGDGSTVATEDGTSSSDGSTTSTTAPLGPPPEARGEVLVEDHFDRPDGVVTDERTWHDENAAPDDDVWAATSGVLHATDGEGWSDSPVFRMVTNRQDLGDVSVSFRLRTEAPTGDDVHPEEAWDGVHVLLHYQDETDLYAVSVARRDGELAIKRKDPGGPSNGGTYTTLAVGPGAMGPGRWTDVQVTIRQASSGIAITITLDGTSMLETVDTSAVGDRASPPGRVGIRADNTTFHIDDVVVQELDPTDG